MADDYAAWLKTNRLAFQMLNPTISPTDFEAAFRIFMYETYEGQLPHA